MKTFENAHVGSIEGKDLHFTNCTFDKITAEEATFENCTVDFRKHDIKCAHIVNCQVINFGDLKSLISEQNDDELFDLIEKSCIETLDISVESCEILHLRKHFKKVEINTKSYCDITISADLVNLEQTNCRIQGKITKLFIENSTVEIVCNNLSTLHCVFSDIYGNIVVDNFYSFQTCIFGRIYAHKTIGRTLNSRILRVEINVHLTDTIDVIEADSITQLEQFKFKINGTVLTLLGWYLRDNRLLCF